MEDLHSAPPVEQMVDEANRVLLNSDALVRLRLVHTAKVAYVEPPINDPSQLQLTLDRLTDPQDGYLDEVHALRTQYGADVVVLLVRGVWGSDGFLAPLRPDAAHAFGVVSSTTDYAFTRVIGRLLGCEAQRSPIDETGRVVGDGAFVDSHAFVISNSQNSVYSTIMGTRLTLIPFFSNPEVICFGSPIGITGAADNVRTINVIAPEVAGFVGTNNSVSPPQVQWQTPAGGALFLPGTNINLQIAVTSPVGVIQNIEFYQAGNYYELQPGLLLTNFSSNPADWIRRTLTNASPGWYHISARATDDQGNSGQAAIEFRVRAQNDDFTDRIQLQSMKDRMDVDLRGMSLEPGEAALVAPGVEATAWYTWTSPGDGYLQARAVSKTSVYYTIFTRAYYGSTLTQLAPAGVNPDRGSALILRVHPGDVVQLSLGCSRNEATSFGLFELTTDFLPLVTNDSFETRIPVSGAPVTIAGHNVNARSATNAVWPNPIGPTVWWSWTPSVSGIAQIQASNFLPYQIISVFQGDLPETLSGLAGLSPYYAGTVSQGFPVHAGQPLPVAVTSPAGYPTGAFAFRLAVLTGAANNTFSDRLSRTGSEWNEPLLFPTESASGAPTGVGAYATWWEWTAPQSGTVRVAINGWGAPRVSVFTGNTLASLQTVPGLQAGWGTATFTVSAGTKYQLALSWDGIPYYLGAGFAPVFHLGYTATNDNFAQRIVLGGAPIDWDLTNAYGTAEAGEPDSPSASWWYSWTTPTRGRVTFSATGQVGIAVFRGGAVNQLTNVPFQAYGLDNATFVADPGVQYQIVARAWSLDSLPLSAHLHLDFKSLPSNDEFAGHVLLTGSDYAISGDLALATGNPTDPVIPNSSANPHTLWWRWIVPADGLANIASLSSWLAVYRGNTPATLTPVIYCQSYTPTILGVKAGDVLELMLAGDGYYPASFQLKLLPLWGNDFFYGRTSLGTLGNNPLALRTYDGNTQGATREIGETLSGTNTSGHSRWWTWNTPVSAIAKVSVSPSTGPVYVEQFRGDQLASLGSIAWQQAPFPTLRFHADSVTEYPLAVDSIGGSNCTYSVSVDLIPDAPAPANDMFQNAQVLVGPAAKVQGTHRTATAELGEPAHGGITAARSLWFRWIAPRTGRTRLSAKAISLDAAAPIESYSAGTLAQPNRPGLGVYTGTTLASLVPESFQSIPTTNVYESTVEFDAVANQSYALALEGGAATDADVGEFELQLVQLPTNDDFTNRIVLQGPLALLSGTVFGATRATNEWVAQWPSSSPVPSMMNVWWEWTAPADLRVTLRNVRSNDHFWAVWRSGDNRQWVPRVSVMDRYFGWEDTRRDFVAHAGETWYIAVYANPANTSPVEMELEGVPVPINDNFAGRLPLSGERVSISARGDNTSREINEPPHGMGTVSTGYGGVTNAPSLWWSWTAPHSGLFALTTEAQDALRAQQTGFWDQVKRADCFVYQGSQITGLTKLAGTSPDISSPPSGMKRITFAASAGATYQIALCPIFVENRIWDTAKYFVNLAIDPVADNSSPDTAWQLVGSSPVFSGNLRSAVDNLWWRWTAPQSGPFAFAQRLGGADITRQLLIQVYHYDSTGTNLVLVDSNIAQAGETYWFKVSVQLLNWSETPPTWDGRDLPFDAALGLTLQATNNDNFAQRELLTGEVAVLIGDNTNATREAGEPIHGGALGRGSLWWQWSAPHSGRWTLASRTAWWQPILIDVYRGSTLSTLQRVPTDRNPLRGDVSFQAQGGETYAIAIDNPSYTTGSFEVDLIQYLAPPNDLFAGRILLNRPAPVWTARNVGASTEPGEPSHAGCAPGASIWWSWTAQCSSAVTLSVSGDSITLWGPPRMAVYRGDSLTNFIPVGNNRVGGELVSNLTFQAQAGLNYSIALDTLPEETGTFLLALTPTNAPVNDNFAHRLNLTGAQVQSSGFNFAATVEPAEPNPPGSQLDATLWWSWRALGSGPAVVDTSGSDFDTGVAVYRGRSLAALNLVSQNDDIGTLPDGSISFGSRVTFNAQSGITYQIQVGSITGDRGLVSLSVQGPSAPPAQLLSAQLVNGGGMVQLSMSGTVGQTVWIQASDDLVNWEWAGSLQFVSANATWNESIPPGAVARFYRLVSTQ
jgi:hypothetical protein